MKMLIIASAFGATVAATQPVAQPLQPLQQRNLSRAQARDRADQLFERFDLNHDGYVTRGEAQLLGGKLLLLRASTLVSSRCMNWPRSPPPGVWARTGVATALAVSAIMKINLLMPVKSFDCVACRMDSITVGHASWHHGSEHHVYAGITML